MTSFISQEIERQNQLLLQDIPTKYKPILEKVMMQYSSHFSVLEIVRKNIDDPMTIRPKLMNYLENRQMFLQEIKQEIYKSIDI
jgi:hypothetical protein